MACPVIACGPDTSKTYNPPPTDKSHPRLAKQLFPAYTPTGVIGSILTSTVVPGTVSVEASFDDQSPEITAKVFTVHDNVPYFALVKPGSASPDWKTATVRCPHANGKELSKLYFVAPTTTDSTW